MRKLNIFLIVGMFLLLVLPTVSAFEFDNTKNYNDNTNTVTIKNCAVWAIVCLVEGETLAEVQLISPINNQVGLGNQMVAELKFSNFGTGNLDNMNMDF